MISYFDVNNDAALVKWSHAVNNRKKLTESLKSDSTFLEADILLIDSKHSEPIMAHPPLTDSDLTFSQWLNISKSSKKGLKLDFKTWNSVEPCLKTLKSIETEVNVPVILNADILQGINSPMNIIEGALFINTCLKNYPKGALSLGWTTNNNSLGNYQWSDVYKMFQLLKNEKILESSTQLTFPVRLLWSINSINRLAWLEKFTNGSLTLWSHKTDTLR